VNEDLHRELAALKHANENSPSWGGAVAARAERIREIERELRRAEALDRVEDTPGPALTIAMLVGFLALLAFLGLAAGITVSLFL